MHSLLYKPPALKFDPFIRYRFGETPKAIKPPELPPPAKSPVEISEQAMKAGEAERRRIRGRRGRMGTIFAGGRGLAPAVTSQAKLGTELG